MNSEAVRKEIIDESRASFLLGLPKEQLREICELSGLGRLEEFPMLDEGTDLERAESAVRMVFTYEELHRLCRLIVGPTS